jgi:hypothetical protein
MIRKKDLRNGMIVMASDGRYGVVCLKDATDENCIKFFYDPNLPVAHGSVDRAHCGDFIVSLNQFTEDLKYICSAKEARALGLIPSKRMITLWSIKEAYSLKREWVQSTCMSSCNHLIICKEPYDKQVVGCCRLKDNTFIGTMQEIHDGTACCIAENECFNQESIGPKINNEMKIIDESSVSGNTKKFR